VTIFALYSDKIRACLGNAAPNHGISVFRYSIYSVEKSVGEDNDYASTKLCFVVCVLVCRVGNVLVQIPDKPTLSVCKKRKYSEM
jgi:hypothetical protein